MPDSLGMRHVDVACRALSKWPHHLTDTPTDPPTTCLTSWHQQVMLSTTLDSQAHLRVLPPSSSPPHSLPSYPSGTLDLQQVAQKAA